MAYSFHYKVIHRTIEVIIAEADSIIELNEEQLKRINASKETGKYKFIDEDKSLEDIFKLIYDEAMRQEIYSEYSDEVGTTIFPFEFNYPVVFKPMTMEERLKEAYKPWID